MSVRAALRRLFSRKTIGKDAVSGLVLGIEAVPDGLAAGLLAGLNPLARTPLATPPARVRRGRRSALAVQSAM